MTTLLAPPATRTILWEGPGELVVYRLVGAAFSGDVARQRGMSQRVVLSMQPLPDNIGAPDSNVLAWSCAPEQIKKIARNPDRWAYNILCQRVRTARARLADAQRDSDRWAALAGHFGIER